jgi:hypothetical protein
MSFGKGEVHSFFGPLSGKTATFLVPGRSANLAFGRAVLSLLSTTGDSCTVLDLDALYSSNSDKVFADLPPAWAESATLQVPDPGSRIEEELPQTIASDSAVVVIDSMNTLNHLLAADDGSSRSRKLSFAVAGLSYLARTGPKAIFFTMYRREGFGRLGGNRSISALSDVTASVEVHGSELSVRCERGAAWPGGKFSTRIP